MLVDISGGVVRRHVVHDLGHEDGSQGHSALRRQGGSPQCGRGHKSHRGRPLAVHHQEIDNQSSPKIQLCQRSYIVVLSQIDYFYVCK